jgi:hypothetical protein
VATRQTTPPEAEVEEENQVTTPSDLGFAPAQREIEVESLEPVRSEIDADGYVEVRMAETIEEFTYGNPHRHYRLEGGKRYRIPVDVARYLNGLGKLYHQ